MSLFAQSPAHYIIFSQQNIHACLLEKMVVQIKLFRRSFDFRTSMANQSMFSLNCCSLFELVSDVTQSEAKSFKVDPEVNF